MAVGDRLDNPPCITCPPWSVRHQSATIGSCPKRQFDASRASNDSLNDDFLLDF
jgi:hypothetical protein